LTLRLLPPVPRPAEVRYIRRKPAKPVPEFGSFAALKTPADWRRFSQQIFGDDRLMPDEPKRVGNVIPLPLPGRRSTSDEIQAVRLSEERRGKRR